MMFDKYLCKHINKTHIKGVDVLVWALPTIMFIGMSLSSVLITVFLMGWKIAFLLFGGMLVLWWICNLNIATCPREENK